MSTRIKVSLDKRPIKGIAEDTSKCLEQKIPALRQVLNGYPEGTSILIKQFVSNVTGLAVTNTVFTKMGDDWGKQENRGYSPCSSKLLAESLLGEHTKPGARVEFMAWQDQIE